MEGPQPRVDLSHMRVEVETTIHAEPSAVWDLITDLERIGDFSPECKSARWLDPGPVRAGRRFKAVNFASADDSWSVIGRVIEARRPTSYTWIVLDDLVRLDRVSSTWKYDLRALDDGGTLLRHSFEHGPGLSGMREAIDMYPDRATELVDDRCAQLREHILATLSAMAAELERRGDTPPTATRGQERRHAP